jgi:hypothetical protein
MCVCVSPWDSVMGAIEDSISQCPFLQMTYTAENPHADGNAASGALPRLRSPRRTDPHATFPAPTTTGCLEDKCPVVSKLPLHSHAAAEMSPHISIGPEPVLTVHASSQPAAGSLSTAFFLNLVNNPARWGQAIGKPASTHG